MLENYFDPIMHRKRLNNKMNLQQDDPSPHFAREVRIWLSEKFNGRLIGRSRPISWASSSPDLMTLRFFL